MKIRPKHLNKGDTVGIIALSGPINLESLQRNISLFTDMGLHYKLGKTIELNEHDFEETDEAWVHDLHQMIEDPEVKGIFCATDRYGAAKIADKIDYPLLTEHPKIFWGFSDITFLHIAIQQYSNVVTFHGPSLSKELDEQSKKMFYQLFSPFEIYYDETISPLESLIPGSVRGEFIGGNLRRIVDTLGTKFEIDTRDKILLIEDEELSIEEIDRMFNHLRLAGKLKEACGFVIGRLGNGDVEENALSLIKEYLLPYKKPTVARFNIGHSTPNIGIPLGVDVILDADEKLLRFLPGVE